MDGKSVSHRMGKLRIPIAIAVMLAFSVPPADAFWGKYGSKWEAEKACEDRLRELNKRFEKSPYDSFWCQEEAETKQFMLMHFKKREGEAWKFKTVEKRFRY